MGSSLSFGRLLPGMIADERHEAAAFQHFRGELAGALFDKLQLLVVGVTNRNDHAAALGKLREEWLGRCRRRSGNEDGVEWRKFGKAERTVSAMHMDVEVREPLQSFRSGGS